jgi:hypothetical protein
MKTLDEIIQDYLDEYSDGGNLSDLLVRFAKEVKEYRDLEKWPNKLHESHKAVRSSDASTFDFICDDCGATDSVPGGWAGLSKPCSGIK